MWAQRMVSIILAVAFLGFQGISAEPPPQKYAPIVGRWRIEVKFEKMAPIFEFETHKYGHFGYGTGFCYEVLGEKHGPSFPVTWCNYHPDKFRITSELYLFSDKKRQDGSLILRMQYTREKGYVGEARFMDEAGNIQNGTFTMTRLDGPAIFKEPREQPFKETNK